MIRLLLISTLLFSSQVFAMGSKKPYTDSDDVTQFPEPRELPEGSYCPDLAAMAKAAQWSMNNPQNKKPEVIVVDKARRLLHLVVGDSILKTYRMALGKSPVGPKRQQGDNKTPEGLYHIEYKNSASDYHLSLAVSYPNAADREWARQNGVSPGGDIMVHGLPNNPFARMWANHPKKDWTAGCIAVNNQEIEEIYSLVPAGTPIEICK